MSSKTFALVTGASSGIGKAIAEELASRKINVLLVALPNTGLPDVVTHLNKQYAVRAFGYELDLTHPESPQKLLAWCQSNHYPVNILINNAGFGNLCSFEETDPALLTTMMALNNKAMVLLTHWFIPELKRNGVSHILNVGSLASFMPIPNKSVYAATKSFVYAFSSALRLELMSSGIYVSCLCPGGTVTSIEVQERAKKAGGFGKAFAQQPEAVALEAVQGMFRRKQKIIPGWHNRVLYAIRQMLPEWLVGRLLTLIFTQRKLPVQKPVVKPSPGYSIAMVFR
jgi:uncharacterized protein